MTDYDCDQEIDEVLTSDDPGEYPEALIRASRMAMKRQRIIYIYTDGYFFRAVSSYRGKSIAKCWPGGRVVSSRPVEDK